MGGFGIGLLTGGAGILYVYLSHMPQTPLYFGVVGVVTLFIGMAEFALLAAVIDSGVSTTFVCLAEGIVALSKSYIDPLALASKQPELFTQIQAVYPQVLFF